MLVVVIINQKKERQIKYIEKGLENFYIPVLNALGTSSCQNDETNQIFSKCRQYSYLADKEVHCLFLEYMKKRAEHPDYPNSNNIDCDIFKELLTKVREGIDKNQRKLRELIE